jgi:hypothetical protein
MGLWCVVPVFWAEYDFAGDKFIHRAANFSAPDFSPLLRAILKKLEQRNKPCFSL